jgi:hypothetical protein
VIGPWLLFAEWVDSLSRPWVNVTERWLKKLERTQGSRKW